MKFETNWNIPAYNNPSSPNSAEITGNPRYTRLPKTLCVKKIEFSPFDILTIREMPQLIESIKRRIRNAKTMIDRLLDNSLGVMLSLLKLHSNINGSVMLNIIFESTLLPSLVIMPALDANKPTITIIDNIII